jgi:hypothetical protein
MNGCLHGVMGRSYITLEDGHVTLKHKEVQSRALLPHTRRTLFGTKKRNQSMIVNQKYKHIYRIQFIRFSDAYLVVKMT